MLNDHEHLYFDPVLNNYEPTRSDLFSIEPWEKDRLKRLSPHYLKAYLTTVSTEAFPLRSPPLLPIPTNDKKLYHNLMHILRTRTSSRPTLAALLDYHLLFPDYHSVESYNLLISLSIHHRSYGITQKLFRTMQDRSIQYDTETHRLYVRWFIFKGHWDRAWSYAMQLRNNFPGGSIPFPIWLEFCHARNKGPIIGDTFNPKTKKKEIVSEPVSLISARRKVMNTNRPLSIPALKDTLPADIRNIVLLMVKSGLKQQALKLTEDYFRALSLKMNGRVNHRCLDIVKIHLVFNGSNKTGLPRFYAAKTLFLSLLSFNPSLRPTSDTLMFILSILKRVKQSGTVAWKFIFLCKEKWGHEVEDRPIRRRVLRLALKEGRMDIVETLMQAETMERRAHRTSLAELEVVGDSIRSRYYHKLDRPSIRRIYPHNGRESYMWYRLRLRVYRTMINRKARGRQFIKRKAQISGFTKRARSPALTSEPALTRKPIKSKARRRRFTKRKAQKGRDLTRRAQSPALTSEPPLARKSTKSIS